MRLPDKVALVTGGGRGIGKGIALRLGSEGADVAVCYEKNEVACEEVVQELRSMGRKALAMQADIGRSDQVGRMAQMVLGHFGRIDILVNNAGFGSRVPFLEITEEQWDRMMEVDLKGPFLVGQAVAKHMVGRRAGCIINIVSISSFMAVPLMAHYQAAKAGVHMLTRSMALELAPYGVRVNGISPGMVETEAKRARVVPPDFHSQRIAKIPVGRYGQPEDIAGAVVYLASDDASFVAGSIIVVDGGQTVQ